MPSIINIKSEEINFTAANTVNDAKLVRLYASANTLVTVEDPTANTTVGSFTVPGNSIEYVIKKTTDTISANATIYCSAVGFTA